MTLPLNAAQRRELANLRRCASYDCIAKKAFHSAAKSALRRLVKKMGLVKGQYDLHTCNGGDAIAGETILHTDHFQVFVTQELCQPGCTVLYRSCAGRRDHVGGVNRYTGPEELVHGDALASLLLRVARDQGRMAA
ncbi:MAG TPA: hypothetical protein VF277_09480 [Steroidobacteraceae bacterium]